MNIHCQKLTFFFTEMSFEKMIALNKRFFVLITLLQCISFCSVSVEKKDDWSTFTVYNVRNDYVQRIRYVKTFYLNNSIFGLISKKELREEDLCDGDEIEHIKFSQFSAISCALSFLIYCPVYLGVVCRK